MAAAEQTAADLATKLAALVKAPVRVFRAPGRVNLIGEHTDYNDGFVMPAAIGFYTWVAAAPRADRMLTVRSENFGGVVEVSLDAIPQGATNHWSDYVRGVAGVLERAGHRLRGADLLIKGEVPMGAGLSSSAAIEVGTGTALMALSGLPADGVALARFCQQAEHEYVGTRCGIMDQFISANGRAGHALMLDCRSLTFQLAPLAGPVSLVICNTLVKHELATGEYNVRRAECEAGVRHIARSKAGIKALRDVTLDELERFGHDLTPVIRQRCRHVIGENARVVAAAAALAANDLAEFGRLMGESHASLRDDYQVSCPELDVMVELAQAQDGVLGARMTGGGFGGCTVNLVRAERVDAFRAAVGEGYRKATGHAPEIHVCTAADGAREVSA